MSAPPQRQDASTAQGRRGGSHATGRDDPRRLRGDEQDAFAAARLLALDWMPYLASALFEVIPVRSPGLGTFAVDAHWRLYLDPAKFETWEVHATAGVLLHEVGHLVRDHQARGAEQPDHGPLAWNLAADAEINDDLLAARIPLPDGPVTPAVLGQPDGQLAEHYLAAVAKLRPWTDPRCGEGAGGAAVGVELDPDDPDHPARSALDQELIRRQVAHDVSRAGEHDTGEAGRVPRGWLRWADRALAPPVVRWQQRLRRSVRHSLAARAGQLDLSYRRPGRRRIDRVVTPGMVQPRLRVGVVVDTSASMGGGQLQAALAELDGICHGAGVDRDDRVVVTADAAVHEMPRLRRAADLPIRGGGGTDLRPAIERLHRQRRRPHVIIVLTDGHTPWPEQPAAGTSLIAVLIPRWDDTTPAPQPPGFVDTIRLPVD